MCNNKNKPRKLQSEFYKPNYLIKNLLTVHNVAVFRDANKTIRTWKTPCFYLPLLFDISRQSVFICLERDNISVVP